MTKHPRGWRGVIRAVPFKSVGEGRIGRFFEGGGQGSNSELFYPMRLDMISGRREGGGGCRILNYLPFLPSPKLLNGTALLDCE